MRDVLETMAPATAAVPVAAARAAARPRRADGKCSRSPRWCCRRVFPRRARGRRASSGSDLAREAHCEHRGKQRDRNDGRDHDYRRRATQEQEQNDDRERDADESGASTSAIASSTRAASSVTVVTVSPGRSAPIPRTHRARRARRPPCSRPPPCIRRRPRPRCRPLARHE